MNETFPAEYDELLQLADAVCSGPLADNQVERLSQLLGENEVHRRLYLGFCRMQTELIFSARVEASEAAALVMAGVLPSVPEETPAICDLPRSIGSKDWLVRRPKAISFVLATAAMLLIIACMAILRTRSQMKESEIGSLSDPLPHAVDASADAKLTATFAARWSSPQGIELNQPIYRGARLKLEEGLAEFEFSRGSRLVVEGPAEFIVESDAGIRLTRGRVTARVLHPRRNFTVRAGSVMVEDLGTEFGVAWDGKSRLRVQVFEGLVRVVAAKADAPADENDTEAAAPAETVREPIVLGKDESLEAEIKDDAMRVAGQNDAKSDEGFTRSIPRRLLQPAALLDSNLIRNGDFELGPRGVHEFDEAGNAVALQPRPVAFWPGNQDATVLGYESAARNGFPDPNTNSVPPDRGEAFFHSRAPGTVKQEVSLISLAERIDAGEIRAELSGWLGGFRDNPETGELVVTYLDVGLRPLGRISIGPVTAEDRENKTGFLRREAMGTVPAGARAARIELVCGRGPVREACDVHADSLRLVLRATDSGGM